MCRAECDLEACWNRILTIFDPYTFSHSQGHCPTEPPSSLPILSRVAVRSSRAGLSPAGSHQLAAGALFDHLVGASDQCRRYFQPEGPGGLEIEHELEFRRLLDRKVSRLCTFEHTIHIVR